MITALLPIISKVLDRVIPDPAARDAAKAALLQAQQAGEFRELELQANMIVAEAQSDDPYTSRARPSFLYVVYIYVLAAIPYGALFVLAPDQAAAGVEGVQAWLSSIPEEMWWLFGTGYLGYTGARSIDKRSKLNNLRNPR